MMKAKSTRPVALYRDILKLARQFDIAPNVSAGSSLQYQSRATTLGIHIRNEANRR